MTPISLTTSTRCATWNPLPDLSNHNPPPIASLLPLPLPLLPLTAYVCIPSMISNSTPSIDSSNTLSFNSSTKLPPLPVPVPPIPLDIGNTPPILASNSSPCTSIINISSSRSTVSSNISTSSWSPPIAPRASLAPFPVFCEYIFGMWGVGLKFVLALILGLGSHTSSVCVSLTRRVSSNNLHNIYKYIVVITKATIVPVVKVAKVVRVFGIATVVVSY